MKGWLAETLGAWSDRREKVDGRAHDDLVALVEGEAAGADDAVLLARVGETDAYNLDLSKRRAAAVKDTLVTGYHLTATRLTTAGYGAASPVDSNATLEGRARNRRVELIRQ